MTDKPIRLGLLAPLTGLVDLYGQDISNAAHIAVAQINRQGGVNGRQLELIVVDDGSLPDTAVPAAKELIERHDCQAIIGSLLSNSRIAVHHDVIVPHKIPYLNFSFYEGSIYSRYFFHFAALPNQQIDKVVPWMLDNYGSKFYFAGSNYEWPRGSIAAAKNAVIEAGGEIIGEEYFDFDVDDFYELLQRVRREGADVFMPFFAGYDQIRLLTQFTDLGLKNKMGVVMGYFDEIMLGLLPDYARGGFYSSNTYFMSLDTPQNKRYLNELADMQGINGIWPEGNGVVTNFGEGTYNCVMAWAKAAEKAGTFDKEAVLDALKTIEIDGLQGPVVMDPLTNHASVNTWLARSTRHGEMKIIESLGFTNPEIPERYKHETYSIQDDSHDEHYLEDEEETTSLSWRFLTVVHIQYDEIDASLKEISPGINHLDDITIQQIITSVSLTDLKKLQLEQKVVLPKSQGINHPKLGDKIKLIPLCVKSNDIELAILSTTSQNAQSSETLFEVADMAMIVVSDKGVITKANRGAADMFGYDKASLIGITIDHLIPPRLRKAHQHNFSAFAESDIAEKRMRERSEVNGYRRDGSEFPLKASLSRIEENGQLNFIVTLADISRQKEYETELVWNATHDTLTGLPNRGLIQERIDSALNRSKKTNSPVIVLFLDLDGFKIINDSYGHAIGDLLLRRVAEKLLNHARPGDTIARFGGDEFLILCERDTENHEEISRYIESINQLLKQPVSVQGIEMTTSVSIGAAVGYGGIHHSGELLKNADVAMYWVKDRGRDSWIKYDKELHEHSRLQISVAKGLASAMDDGQLRLYFQPIVDAKAKKIVAGEALCRWFDGEKMISPAVFIPIAETTGQIASLGLWVLEQVCQQLQQWKSYLDSGELNYISVNLSAYQLQDPKLPQQFADILERYHVSPDNILLEVTETTIMKNIEGGVMILEALGKLGFHIAIDDFGTGYSSLGQLVKLPVGKLKVDKVFVDDIETSDEARMVLTTIMHLADGLNLEIIAEGVETKAQFGILGGMSVDYIQGYYFYPPLPENKFCKLLTGPGTM